MEILHYTKAHQEFRERLRHFCETEVVPHVNQWEIDGIVPKSAWRKMGAQGFLCPSVPKEYGGMGGDFLHSVIVSEELTRTRHSGLMATLHSDVVVPYIESFASEKMKKKYLPKCVSGEIITAVAMTEPGAGSDLAGLSTTAVENGDGIIINGSKTFISNGFNADLLVLAAKDPAIENPHAAISLWLLETQTPGFKRGNRLKKMGMSSQDTAELFFTNCKIPVENRLGEKGGGFLMLMEKLQQERLVTAIGAVVAAEQMVEWTVAYCKKTVVSGKRLSKGQAVRFAIVELTTEVKIGRTFIDKLIADHMAGENIVVETSMAKYWTTDMVKRVADRCLDLVGDYASLEECPIVRPWRDVRVMSIFAGTNEIMKEIASRFMGL